MARRQIAAGLPPVALVVLVVSGHLDDARFETSPGPFAAAFPEIDIAGEDDDIRGWRPCSRG